MPRALSARGFVCGPCSRDQVAGFSEVPCDLMNCVDEIAVVGLRSVGEGFS